MSNVGSYVIESRWPDEFGNMYVPFDTVGTYIDDFGTLRGGKFLLKEFVLLRLVYFEQGR